jgi:tRNA-Thr(GGU) m(6)t(6)A37 methyltransferase TsaA
MGTVSARMKIRDLCRNRPFQNQVTPVRSTETLAAAVLLWEPEVLSRMFTARAIGFVRSPYKDASEVPKGLGARHEADGVLAILPEFEAGLTDIEGFSHLVVLWEFDRSHGFELLGTPPSDNRAHGVFATRSPRRPNPIGLTIVELVRRDGLELHVRGVDMLDGTPILDIKPLLSSIQPETLRRGWLAEAEAGRR